MELETFARGLIDATPYTLPLLGLIAYLIADIRYLRDELDHSRFRTRALYRKLAGMDDEKLENGG